MNNFQWFHKILNYRKGWHSRFMTTTLIKKTQIISNRADADISIRSIIEYHKAAFQPLINQSYPFGESLSNRIYCAFDAEGHALGRYGQLCLLQIFFPRLGTLLLFDTLKDDTISLSLKEILESKDIVKIVHDCREDSSLLYHQYGVKLNNVFDTQVAKRLISLKCGLKPYQASLGELFKEYLDIQDSGISEIKDRLQEDPNLFCKRPLDLESIKYASLGVLLLPKLSHSISHSIDPAKVIKHSYGYTKYRDLNKHIMECKDFTVPGTVIEGILVSQNEQGMIFKLNAPFTGVVRTISALNRFKDVSIGDIVTMQVSNISDNGKILYLDRYDGLYNYWNLKERPRKHYYTTHVLDTENLRADPLLFPDN